MKLVLVQIFSLFICTFFSLQIPQLKVELESLHALTTDRGNPQKEYSIPRGHKSVKLTIRGLIGNFLCPINRIERLQILVKKTLFSNLYQNTFYQYPRLFIYSLPPPQIRLFT